MKLPKAFHTPLVAAIPVLALYRNNLALFPLSDLWRPLGIVVGASLVLWALASAILRNWERGALAATVATAWVLAYGHVVRLFTGVSKGQSWESAQKEFLWKWVLVGLAALVAVLCSKKAAPALTRLFNATAAVLTLLIAIGWVSGRLAIQRDVAWINKSEVATDGKLNASERKPDVFYIILDGHGSVDSLRQAMGVNEGPFVDALEARGFYVAKDSRSNYCQTELSLASSLNMQAVQQMLPKMDSESMDRWPLDDLIDKNAVAERLRRAGYAFIAVTSGFPGLKFRSADLVARYETGMSLLESSLVGDLPIASDSFSPKSQFDIRREQLNQAFATLRGLAKPAARPRFVIAHIMAPHPPFVFKADGSPAPKSKVPYGFWDASHYMEMGGTPESYETGYAEQIQYVDSKVLVMVDALLSASGTPPIIVIQGDHGSKLGLDQESLENTDLHECFGILNAYFVPGAVRKDLYSRITPINTFRAVFRGMFGDRLPPLPDRSAYSTWSHPYKFVDVTDKAR